MGDKSDNLKGVAGIGEKKAQLLIQTYHSIEGIYEHLDEIKGAMHRYLVEGEASAFLTKEIATIQTNVYLEDFGIYQLNLTINPLIDFFKKYEMFSLVRPYTNKINNINHEELVAVKVLDRWDRSLEGTHNAIFVESLETNYHVGHILGIGISNEHGNFYLDFLNHQQSGVLAMLDPAAAISLNSDSAFQEFLNSDVDKGTYDLKRSVKLLQNANYTVNFDSFHYDLASVGYILNPSITSTFQNHIRLLRPD
jgi:DNA polymerase-1